MTLWGVFAHGLIPSEDVGGKITAGKELWLALGCVYGDKGLCMGWNWLVLPSAGKSHQFLDWNSRVMPSLRDLALTTHTWSCTPGAPLCTPLCSWLLLWMEKEPSESKEQSRVILPWPLISITGEGDHLCIRLCKEPRVTRASMRGQPGITQRPRDAAY